MSFAGGLFGGSNPTLSSDIGNAGLLSGFGTSVGMGDLSTASGFYNTLLGGNQAAIARLLAPQIQTQQKQGQAKIQSQAQFGTRSGGGNAGAQNEIDTERSNVTDMITGLTSGAASGLTGIGESALSTGLAANELQAKLSQQQLDNWKQSILGTTITGGINYAESFLPVPHGG